MRRPFWQWVDVPPVWLGLALAAVWGFDQAMPWGLFGPSGRWVGAVLGALGVGLMAAAVGQMWWARTTVVPRGQPRVLITRGVFGWTRNPIYLADVLILSGAVLWWDVPVAVPLVLGFLLMLQHRFVLPEEAVLRAGFGAAFAAWTQRTGRWFGRNLR
ncbi:isoprenylcysteine carboxylmethyltransferase family protein [Pseudorhodobacter sp. MZDSW-24AT]|uniref:methyltransferase family protein n=1 Tax=Pseudorhodobacter sp. MZDSW-24AT TaxID=2052957 RepID=UPI000C1F3440|nr:methyltransferase [Pseudorhodobacter sp. MZDSW-24AT]PJF08170.1 S-isoprenylcysteine methyltransferase [Pseudorhodobacter sp. MZDSW-24AT]